MDKLIVPGLAIQHTPQGHHDKSFIQRKIEQADKQIDQLVYELYGLTEEEGRLVEEQR